MIVIADTSPINYLILIQAEDLLQLLFGRVVIPWGVLQELQHPDSPSQVREWSCHPPEWVELRRVGASDPTLDWLGLGEREGLTLAQQLGADLILIDDHPARLEAQKRHFRVTGTLGILRNAAQRDLIDLSHALQKLQLTNFHAPSALIAELFKEATEKARNR